MAKVTVTFSLDSEADKDILSYLASLPKREKSATFRAMARAYIGNAGLTLGDLYQELVEIRRMLKSGAFVAGSEPGGEPAQEDDPLMAEVESLLSNLGL